MPACVTATICNQSDSVNLLMASRSFSSTALNGCVSFHSGCCGASLPKRSSANMAWVYNGCSVQSVPSWSKVATRSFGSTYLELDFSVVSLTNEMIAFFEAPLFHEGRGSSSARDTLLKAPRTAVVADTLNRSLRVISIYSPSRLTALLTCETVHPIHPRHLVRKPEYRNHCGLACQLRICDSISLPKLTRAARNPSSRNWDLKRSDSSVGAGIIARNFQGLYYRI